MVQPIKLRPAPLWRERGFTPEFFRKMQTSPRAEVAAAYNRGYRLVAINDSDKTFPHYPNCRRRGVVLGDILRNGWPTFTGVDLSGSKRKGNAIVTVAVDPYSKVRYVVDVRMGAWRSSETAVQISIVYEQFHPKAIFVEDNGYQEALIDWMKVAGLSCWPIVEPTTTTGYTKHSSELGLPALDIEFKNEAWVIPWSEFEGASPEDPGQRGMWARLDVELANHPFAATADGTMATWFARQAIDRNLHYFTGDAGGASVGNLSNR